MTQKGKQVLIMMRSADGFLGLMNTAVGFKPSPEKPCYYRAIIATLAGRIMRHYCYQ